MATKLSKKRKTSARKLESLIIKQLHSLGMTASKFYVSLEPLHEKFNRHGLESVEFLISTIAGQQERPLNKIASGGELSRISLAIQVVTASTGTVPRMVFDEVDVGIGGAVAEVVGKLLRNLSGQAQVLCVTHLPQVAAQGNQHLLVSKTSDKKSVETRLQQLLDEEKVHEIARMLGGVKITEQTLAHAREMLEA